MNAGAPAGLLADVAPGDGRAAILVVDDRSDKRLAFTTLLEDLQQEVVTAASGEEALKLVLQREFAVILLDVNMPGMDGFETAALIRSRRKSAHTPIIFVTADYNDEPHTASGYALGAVDYIGSPVVPEILRAKVRVFVDLYLLAQQARRRADEHIALAEETAARVAAERTTRRLAFLSRASATLGQSLDTDAIVEELGRLAVPALAELSFVSLRRGEDVPSSRVIAWYQPGRGVEHAVVDGSCDAVLEDAIDRVMSGGDSEHWSLDGGVARKLDFPVELAPGRTARSVIVAPLPAHGRCLGVLVLGLREDGRAFDPDTLSMVGDLASRAGIALDNAALYQKIHEADQRKNEFIAMLAHELRNPLAPIRNAVHLLQEGDRDPTRAAWAHDVINRQLRQLVRLVDDLLDLSRITRGKIDLKFEAIDAASVVATALETSRPIVDDLGHALTVNLPSAPVRLRGDFARVAQVLANIVNNAAKYTGRGGRIALSVAREGDEVVFSVRDTGVGIPRECLSSIFDPFTQLDRTIDRSQGGLGIGLTLVRRLVEMQGGSVKAFSEGRDLGSEFVVRLPATTEPPAQEAPAPRAEVTPRANGERRMSVLVVDDNVDVAESTAILLRLTGCEVHLAHDGPGALESVQRFEPDAVLLDIGLPRMDGYQVAQRIRSYPQHRSTLLLAVSGYGQEEHRMRSRQAGFDHHLVKPIDPIALMELLRVALGASADSPPGRGCGRA